MGPPPKPFHSRVITDVQADTTVVFTTAHVRDDRALKASQAQYAAAAKSKFADPSKLAAFFDVKPRGFYTDQPAQHTNRQQASINPEWNPAQGNWNQPQPVVELEDDDDDDRPATAAEKAHRRRASLDPRTFRSQPVAYVIKPRDRFSFGIDGSLWRVEQERQRLSRMDASVRPVEYVFNAQVHRDDPAASKPTE